MFVVKKGKINFLVTVGLLLNIGLFAPESLPQRTDPSTEEKTEKEYQDLIAFDDETMSDVEMLRQELEQKTGEELAKIKDLNHRLIADKIFAVRGAYSQFLERYPKHLKTMIAFASFLYDEGETETALKTWRQILMIDPKNAPVHNNLANHYGHMGSWKEALTEYEAAIALAPHEPLYRFNHASVMDLFRKEVAASRGWNETETTRRIIAELKAARDLALKTFSYAKAYAHSLDSAIPPNWQEALAAWKVCLNLADKPEEKDFVNANAARVCIELGDKKKASSFIAAIALPSSLPMKQDLQERLQKLK